MHPPIMNQANFQTLSPNPVVDCSTQPDMARQEFKDEADINVLLRKFGVRVLERSTQPIMQDIDFTLDLQGAYDAREQVQQVHSQLPEEVRNLYPTWADLLNAIERGEIEINSKDLPVTPSQ